MGTHVAITIELENENNTVNHGCPTRYRAVKSRVFNDLIRCTAIEFLGDKSMMHNIIYHNYYLSFRVFELNRLLRGINLIIHVITNYDHPNVRTWYVIALYCAVIIDIRIKYFELTTFLPIGQNNLIQEKLFLTFIQIILIFYNPFFRIKIEMSLCLEFFAVLISVELTPALQNRS
ncbi:hypothetical protein AGLY_014301 [Aphis glycines]|uniref:Uncharacterized protein n=1 Tax=Aphis glycines TaxID=307491 RepID=A0A6G0T3L8_APHGL|nr:hypothetical protein AGLY_014301 [Aphis glycines]